MRLFPHRAQAQGACGVHVIPVLFQGGADRSAPCDEMRLCSDTVAPGLPERQPWVLCALKPMPFLSCSKRPAGGVRMGPWETRPQTVPAPPARSAQPYCPPGPWALSAPSLRQLIPSLQASVSHTGSGAMADPENCLRDQQQAPGRAWGGGCDAEASSGRRPS